MLVRFTMLPFLAVLPMLMLRLLIFLTHVRRIAVSSRSNTFVTAVDATEGRRFFFFECKENERKRP